MAKKKRKRKKQSKYVKARTQHRKKTARHVLVGEADMGQKDIYQCVRWSESGRQLENRVKEEFKKRLDQMLRTKEYKGLQKEYKEAKEALDKIDKEKQPEEYKKADKACKEIGKDMGEMQEKFGITFDDVRAVMEEKKTTQTLNSVFCLSFCEDIWDGIEAVLFRGAKKLHFRRYGDYPELRAKQISKIIIADVDEKGELYFKLKGVSDFRIKVKKNDIFMQEELQAVADFLSDPA